MLAFFPLAVLLAIETNVSWLAHRLPEVSLGLDIFRVFIFVQSQQKLMCITLQGTNISPKNGILKMVFLSQGGIC